MPQIEVTFDIDANGNPPRHGEGPRHREEQRIRIEAPPASRRTRSRARSSRRVAPAEDRKRRDAVEAKNQLDSLVYSTEKLVDESGEKVPAPEKDSVKSAIAEAKKVLEGKATTPRLSGARAGAPEGELQDRRGALQERAAAPRRPRPRPVGGAEGEADDVIDAEVVEEKK